VAFRPLKLVLLPGGPQPRPTPAFNAGCPWSLAFGDQGNRESRPSKIRRRRGWGEAHSRMLRNQRRKILAGADRPAPFCASFTTREWRF